MKLKDAYDEIVSTFESRYSFLGKQFAEQFLLSVASWNVQQYSEPDFRVRRHLLLYWQPGWIKSTLLKKASEILGDKLCTVMSDVTLAALRGTVDYGKFVSPYTLKRPFSLCTEFGQVVGTGSNDIIQKLLNVLEEGIVTVSLAKISTISGDQIDKIQDDYGVRFIDANTFTYKTNWILMAATYNRKFLVDNAFESRFHMVVPTQKLDSKLTKHITNSKPFILQEDAIDTMREKIMDSTKRVDCMIKLPSEVYEENLTVRDSAYLLSTIICRKWWGLNTTKDEIIQLGIDKKKSHDNIWKSASDKVFDAIENEAKSTEDIMGITGLSKRAVYQGLNELRAVHDFKDGKRVHRLF